MTSKVSDTISSRCAKRAFMRSQRSSTSAEYKTSALINHALQEHHVINWADTSVIDRKPDRPTRWIKETIHIHNEGRAMNREEGSYRLSHAYDCFLGTSITYCARNQMKKRCFHSSSGSRNIKVWKFLVVIDEFNHESTFDQMNLFIVNNLYYFGTL